MGKSNPESRRVRARARPPGACARAAAGSLRSGQRVNQALAAIGAGLSIGGIAAYTRSITGALATLDDMAGTSEICARAIAVADARRD
jgi:hypothetical protein